jgi:hypothetical protein
MLVGENAQKVLYNVVVDGEVSLKAVTEAAASQFIATLTEEQRVNCKMVPATENGKEILLG